MKSPLSIPTDSASRDADSRAWTNRKTEAKAQRAALASHASGRRRFVDPTTCERDYSAAEMEFMQAMQDYKQSSGRMFPTWSEVLEVLRSLGYEKPGSESDGVEFAGAASVLSIMSVGA